MSTKTMSVSSHAQDGYLSLKHTPLRPEALVAVAEVSISDRVLIVGRNVIDHVVALVRAGCKTVSSLSAELSLPQKEPVDILWFRGVADVRGRLDSALRGTLTPRLAVIEVDGTEANTQMRPIVRQLRGKGFVRFSIHRTGQGAALVAARPAWLKHVI